MPKKLPFNKDAAFTYLGFTLTPVKLIGQKERDLIFRTCSSIGISNYKDIDSKNYRSGDYNYEQFYQAARQADAAADVFILNERGLVVPCANELFAINKEEAGKINVKKKLYKTVIQVEILSEEPYSGGNDLMEIHNDITFGHCSGLIKTLASDQVLEGKESADEVKRHGTSTEFFMMNDHGYILDEELEID